MKSQEKKQFFILFILSLQCLVVYGKVRGYFKCKDRNLKSLVPKVEPYAEVESESTTLVDTTTNTDNTKIAFDATGSENNIRMTKVDTTDNRHDAISNLNTVTVTTKVDEATTTEDIATSVVGATNGETTSKQVNDSTDTPNMALINTEATATHTQPTTAYEISSSTSGVKSAEATEEATTSIGNANDEATTKEDIATSVVGATNGETTSTQVYDPAVTSNVALINTDAIATQTQLTTAYEISSSTSGVKSTEATEEATTSKGKTKDTPNSSQTPADGNVCSNYRDTKGAGSVDCLAIYASGCTLSGIYTIQPPNSTKFRVYCNMTKLSTSHNNPNKKKKGGWTVIQRRVNGSVDFNRSWNSYKEGFGQLDHEFWLGNEKLHILTNQGNYVLRIDMVTSAGVASCKFLQTFCIMNEEMQYKRKRKRTENPNVAFSTVDRRNSRCDMTDCAMDKSGGWWYKCKSKSKCADTNLNGEYDAINDEKSICWNGSCNMKFSEMKIRKKK